MSTLLERVTIINYLTMDYIHRFVEIMKQWTLPLTMYLGFGQKQGDDSLFYQRLMDGNYDEALKMALCDKSLDKDMVYKCKWLNSEHTSNSIKTILVEIGDKLWAIYQCVEVVPTTFEACATLLEFGLQQANLRLLYMLGNDTDQNSRDKDNQFDSYLSEDTPDDDIEGLIDFNSLNEKQKELCRIRKELLRHRHNLFIYERILGDPKSIRQHFDHVFYEELRKKSPLEACIDFARDSDRKAVTAIFDCCTEQINEHLLPILSNFPETLDPNQYEPLLPCCDDQEVYEWKGANVQQTNGDWSDRFGESRDVPDDYIEEFYKLNPNLKKYSRPLTKDLLSEWFIERAIEIESRTLLITNAIQLLKIGIELKKVPNLRTTHEELHEFYKIIYECCSDDYLDMSFTRFKQMSNLDRLLVMIGNNKGNSEINHIRDKLRWFIIPYIYRRENELGLDGKIELVRDLFHRLANFKEQTCHLLYKALLDQIECDDGVAEWTKDMDDAIDKIGEDIQRIEKDRQANSLNNLATKNLNMGDYGACYEACELIIRQKYKQCWPICSSLALNNKFKDYEAKCKLIAFALLHCDDKVGEQTSKMLNHIIEMRKRDEQLQRAYLELSMQL